MARAAAAAPAAATWLMLLLAAASVACGEAWHQKHSEKSWEKKKKSSTCTFAEGLGVEKIQWLFFQGKLTSVALVKCYLQRIADLSNPKTFNKKLAPYAVNALISLNSKILKEAKSKDKERKKAKCKKPACLGMMHGIPVILKDNVAADGMPNTAGSYALLKCKHPRSTVAAKLKANGAIILGKAGLSEWANWRSFGSVSGWSGMNGQVYDPYVRYELNAEQIILPSPYKDIPSAVPNGTYYNVTNPELVSGSSSGSGVSATLSLATVTVGTETDGSIIFPSMSNAIVGIKPTVGLISRHGIVPISATQDTAGPMCRTVADAVHLLDAMYGPDQYDVDSVAQIGQTPVGGYTQFLKTGGLTGATIAAPLYSEKDGYDSAVLTAYAEAIKKMRDLGAIVDLYPFTSATLNPIKGFQLFNFLAAEYEVLKVDFKADLALYLAGCKWKDGQTPLVTLKDVIAFNIAYYKKEFQGGDCCRGLPEYGNFWQDIFVASEEAPGLASVEYLEARLNCSKNTELLYKFMNGDNPYGRNYTAIAHLGDFGGAFAQGRWPSITVPFTVTAKGLPQGMIFSSTAFQEPKLISLAYDFEQRISMGKRAMPKYCNVTCG